MIICMPVGMVSIEKHINLKSTGKHGNDHVDLITNIVSQSTYNINKKYQHMARGLGRASYLAGPLILIIPLLACNLQNGTHK